tara:strand:+ start:783 stop:2033 length:1251 start_codon:yes stop_codon:yes gene_type:complete
MNIVEYIFIFLVAFFSLKFIRKYPFIIFAGTVFYSLITKQISVSFIDAIEVYSTETEIMSESIGAGIRHLFYNSLMVAGLIMPFYFFRDRKKQYHDSEKIYLMYYLACIAIVGLQSLNILMSGLAFSGNRHDLWLNVPFPFLRSIFGILIIFVPFYAGFLTAKGYILSVNNFIFYGISLFLIYFLYLFASSQGFNGFLVAFIYFSVPLITLLYSAFGVEVIKINFSKGIMLVLFFSVFIFLGSQGLGERGISEYTGGGWAANFLYRVLVLQGSMYYALDYHIWNQGELASLDSLFYGSSTLLENATGDAYAERSVNVAGSIVGVFISVFGYFLSIPFIIIYGVLLGSICIMSKNIILRGRPLEIFLSSYLLLWTCTVYQSGSLLSLISLKYILFLIALFILVKLKKLPYIISNNES